LPEIHKRFQVKREIVGQKKTVSILAANAYIGWKYKWQIDSEGRGKYYDMPPADYERRSWP